MKSPKSSRGVTGRPLETVSSLMAKAGVCHAARDFRGAIEHLRKALKLRSDNADLWHRIGVLHSRLREFDRAERAFVRARELSPESRDIVHDHGVSLMSAFETERAVACFRRVMEIDPTSQASAGRLAKALMTLGEIDEARGVLEPFRGVVRPDPQLAFELVSLAEHEKEYAVGIGVLESLLDRADLLPQMRWMGQYRLARLHDKAGDYDKAFACADEANALHGSSFDGDDFVAQVDGLIGRWSVDAVARCPTAPETKSTPVFLVGMPRSGSSLLEQILSCHPEVGAAGELSEMHEIALEFEVEASRSVGVALSQPSRVFSRPGWLNAGRVGRASRRYDKALAAAAGRRPVRTDKLLDNIMHLGLISRLCPNAKVIVCERHPLDVLVSCYLNHFTFIDFDTRIEDLCTYYEQSRRALEHWRRVLPLEIMEFVYEDVVRDPEAEVRRVLGFLGLPWHGACLDFHKSRRVTQTVSNQQVREPLYQSSVARWRRYEKYLAPAIERLGYEKPPTG